MMILAIIGLLVLGLLLLFLEIFVVPGITIAGIGAGILLLGGIFLSFAQYGSTIGMVTLLVTTIATVASLYFAFKSRTWQHMALHESIDSKVNALAEGELQPGLVGRTVSRMAPMGTIRINEKEYEAKSLTGFLEQATEVEVVQIKKGEIIVKPLNND